MKESRALAMALFDAYSEMADEDQAAALTVLKSVDPAVHDALVQLLVTDALAHELDVPPWLRLAAVAKSLDEPVREEQAVLAARRG
jgi:hypothetical protein